MAADLTPKQAAFVREYLIDCNGKQAAIRAGYSPNGAEVTASKLLTVPKVKAAVDAGQVELAERAGIDAQWVVDRLVENVQRAMQAEPVYDREGNATGEYVYAGAVANGALRLLGQHLGMFKEKVDVNVSGGLTLTALARAVAERRGELDAGE